ISTEPNTQRHQLLLARGGDVYPSPDGSGGLILDLFDGVGQLYDDRQPESIRRIRAFASLREKIEPSVVQKIYEQPTEKAIANYDTRELWSGAREASERWREVRAKFGDIAPAPPSLPYLEAGKRFRDFNVEFHSRLALPFASFFFALLAVPLGVRRIRSGKGAGFAMSLMVILIYWTIYTSLRNAALRGQIDPSLIWIANGVILIWCSWGLWRLRWPGGQNVGLLRRLARKFRAFLQRRAEARRTEAAKSIVGRAETELVELTNLGGTSSRFVRRTDQYVAVQYLKVLGLTLASAYLIFGLVEFKTLAEGLMRRNLSFAPMIEYFPLFLAGRLSLVLPIGSLCAAVVTFTLLARTGELTAMKSVGISMRRATMPVLGLTLLSCLASFLVQDYISPQANRRAGAIKAEISGRQQKIGQLRAHGSWAFGSEGKRLYHYRVYDARAEEFQGLRVFGLDRKTLTIREHRFAESARWNGEQWEIEGGWLRVFDEHGGERFTAHEPGLRVTLDPPDNFESGALSAIPSLEMSEQMSRQELKAESTALDASGYDTTQLRMAYHVKLSLALTPFVMVVLALPFAFRVGRRGSLYGIGVAFILVLVYWAVFAVFRSLGSTGVLEPVLAAWAPNVLFSLTGLWMLLYVPS
ncbi:MAG: LptF/LptG family permease, partial [Acidobacteriota bacterium]|nr:LptF/LptG family permease [Acidobacteriota bacterium]